MFQLANEHNLHPMMKDHFVKCFQALMHVFYRQDVMDKKLHYFISYYMNDMIQFCDAQNFQAELLDILNVVLQQTAEATNLPVVTEPQEEILNLVTGIAQLSLCMINKQNIS